MSLDHAVSRAITRARLIETAVHGRGRWEISIGDVVVPANRYLLGDRIVFSALVPTTPVADLQILSHDGEPKSVRPFRAPDFAPFIVDWELVVAEQDQVAA